MNADSGSDEGARGFARAHRAPQSSGEAVRVVSLVVLSTICWGAWPVTSAHAESRITVRALAGEKPPAVSARLNIQVIVPAVLRMRVDPAGGVQVVTNAGSFMTQCQVWGSVGCRAGGIGSSGTNQWVDPLVGRTVAQP